MQFSRTAALLAFSLLVCAAPGRAFAADPEPTPTQVLLKEIDAAKTAKDDAQLATSLKKISGIYEGAVDADKKLLAGAAGAALKSKTEAVQQAALEALIATKDGETAWKAGLKGELPTEKDEPAKPFALKVLESLKDLHPEGAVPTLLSLFEKAKDPVVCARALSALGGYERSKQRVTILDELIKSIRNAAPSRNAQKASAPTPRWLELQKVVGQALADLTGQSFPDLGDWFKFYDDNKKKPALIFKKEL